MGMIARVVVVLAVAVLVGCSGSPDDVVADAVEPTATALPAATVTPEPTAEPTATPEPEPTAVAAPAPVPTMTEMEVFDYLRENSAKRSTRDSTDSELRELLSGSCVAFNLHVDDLAGDEPDVVQLKLRAWLRRISEGVDTVENQAGIQDALASRCDGVYADMLALAGGIESFASLF